MRVFEELRTMRSNPWSESGGRFNYINFDPQEQYTLELALSDRQEIKLQEKMDQALSQAWGYNK